MEQSNQKLCLALTEESIEGGAEFLRGNPASVRGHSFSMALTKDKRNLFMIVASILAFIALFQVLSYFKVASSMAKEAADPHRKTKVLSQSQSQAFLYPEKGRQHKGLPERKNSNPRVSNFNIARMMHP